MKDTEQNINDVHGSAVIQVAGNMNITRTGPTTVEVVEICNSVVRSHIEEYTQLAVEKAYIRMTDFTQKFTQRLSDIEDTVTAKLQEPSTQVALRETEIGYIECEDSEIREDLVQLLIERMENDERSTRQFIADESRKVLLTLNSTHLSYLALSCLSRIIFGVNTTGLSELLFVKIAPLLKRVAAMQPSDLRYLSTTPCFANPAMLLSHKGIIESLTSIYDLYFRTPVPLDEINKFLKTNPITEEGVAYISNDCGDGYRLSLPRTKFLEPRLESADQSIKDLVKFMIDTSRPLTLEEVKEMLISRNADWAGTLKAMENQKALSYYTSSVGDNLGLLTLRRYTERDLPSTIFDEDEF